MDSSCRDWATLEDVARIKRLLYQTAKKQLQRSRALYKNDDTDGRRRLYAITCFSPEERAQWLGEQASLAPPDSGIRIQDSGTPLATQNPPQSKGTEAAMGAELTTPASILDPACALASPAGAGSPSQEGRESRVESRNLQPILPFAPPSPSEEARAAAVEAIPHGERKYVDRWLAILADSLNGTWKVYQGQTYAGYSIRNGDDWISARARMENLSARTIYAKLRIARQILRDPEIPSKRKWTEIAESIRPKARPGRSSAAFFAQEENAWMWPELRRIWLDQSRPTKHQAWRLLVDLIEHKRRVHGLGHYYQEPTESQARTALEKIPRPEAVFGREGEKAFYNQCAPYISRKPPEFSNLIWSTDQKVGDAIVQDAGHRLGRLNSVSFIDVTSFKWLGCNFAPVLSSDVVMRAAADAMIRTGTKPGYVQHDLGKEFRATRFGGGFYKVKGEALFREAVGLWKRLDVGAVKAIGGNPRTKPIERWHEELRKFDQGFPTWTGNNPEERPERVDRLVAQHYAWLNGQADDPQIPTINEYIERFLEWCVKTWNLETRGWGKYLLGMTPEQCWNAKRPAEGFPRITEDEINYQTCERRKEQVATGGQINLRIHGQRLEYVCDELFPLQGRTVECLLSRISCRNITIIYPVTGGTSSCVATVKQEYDWVPEGEEAHEELKAAIRAQHRVKRAVKTGIQGSEILADAANPMQILEAVESLPASNPLASRGLFGSGGVAQGPLSGPAALPDHPEMGSVEWSMRKRGRHQRETSEEAADEVWQLMQKDEV